MGKMEYSVNRLDNAISEVGTGANPSLSNLVLHGPIDRSLISDSSLSNLEYASQSFAKIYEKQILPKLKGIFRSITKDDYSKITNNRIPRFQRRSGNSIRGKLRNSYRGDFSLDEVTARGLFNRENFNGDYGECAKFWFTKNSEYMLSFRHKNVDSICKKLVTKFGRIDENVQNNYLEFVTDVAENNYSIWTGYENLVEKHGMETCETLLEDLFGVKIVDMDMDRFSKNGRLVAAAGKNLSFHNFNTIKNEDYSYRNDSDRPGGFHLTLSDKALPGFAVEIQYRSLQDEIFNMLGKNASFRYEAEGKKAKFND